MMLPLTSSACSKFLQQYLRRLPGRARNRGIVSESLEPPLSSSVPEKPYTLVLAEDQGFYKTSWQSSLRENLPTKYGIHYCHQSLTRLSNLDATLGEMSEDFATMPSVVLLARGPLVSLVAQYYLESLPLAGLIMVDPMALEPTPSSAFVGEIKSLYATDLATGELQLLDQIQSGAQTRPLKLEAGVIPMLVLTSRNLLQESSQLTAERHSASDGPFGEVKLETVGDGDDDYSELICNWIDDVL